MRTLRMHVGDAPARRHKEYKFIANINFDDTDLQSMLRMCAGIVRETNRICSTRCVAAEYIHHPLYQTGIYRRRVSSVLSPR